MSASKKVQPRLSIVLVSYNSWDWLEPCLKSFRHLEDWKAGDNTIEVILVDNGSQDNSVQKVNEHFSWVKCISLTENLGFSGGNNIGIQHAHAPFVMLLNTDTEWLPHTNIFSLLENFSKNEKIGVVTPKVILPTGELDHASHRGFPSPWNSFAYFTGLAKMFPQLPVFSGYTQSWKNIDSPHEIESCSGAAMIVRASLLPKVGLLDESFFMYAEDIDWCFRFAQAGYVVWYDPSVTVVHHKHKSGLAHTGSWETKERTINAFYDTMKQFFRKHYQDKYPQLVAWGVFAMIELLKKRKLGRERKTYARK